MSQSSSSRMSFVAGRRSLRERAEARKDGKAMTLSQYTPEMFDHMALRLLDVAAVIRKMGEQVRENEIEQVEIHDKKLIEWCEKIESWTDKTASQLPVQVRAMTARRSRINVQKNV